MPNGDDLVSPTGQPLIKERKLVVLKVPKGVQLPPQMLQMIAKQTGCDVVTLPITCELMMGDLAAKEVASCHSAIHAILQLVQLNITNDELGIVRKALAFLCDKTQPGDNSSEVTLLKRLRPL